MCWASLSACKSSRLRGRVFLWVHRSIAEWQRHCRTSAAQASYWARNSAWLKVSDSSFDASGLRFLRPTTPSAGIGQSLYLRLLPVMDLVSPSSSGLQAFSLSSPSLSHEAV